MPSTARRPARKGLAAALAAQFDLMVLDLMLPGMHGADVLSRVVEMRSSQRVVVISAMPEISVRVACLEAGAVDFVGKPFALAELLARVRARLREPSPSLPRQWLSAGPVRLDLRLRRAEVAGQPVELSPRENVAEGQWPVLGAETPLEQERHRRTPSLLEHVVGRHQREGGLAGPDPEDDRGQHLGELGRDQQQPFGVGLGRASPVVGRLPQYLAVLPAHRRGGHGRALWRAAQRWGRDTDAAYQLLQTTPGSPADRLYRSEGAESLGYVCSVTA